MKYSMLFAFIMACGSTTTEPKSLDAGTVASIDAEPQPYAQDPPDVSWTPPSPSASAFRTPPRVSPPAK